MVVIGVDSSGIVTQTPVYMAAVREKTTQKHHIIKLTAADEAKYKKKIGENWRWKLSAILIFRAVEAVIKENDVIQIDTDFQGKKRNLVEKYLRRLFGVKYYGKKLSNPTIQFIPEKHSKNVKIAHNKSQAARHKDIRSTKCPRLDKEIEMLN